MSSKTDKVQFDALAQALLSKTVEYYVVHKDTPDSFRGMVLDLKLRSNMSNSDALKHLFQLFKKNTTVDNFVVYFEFAAIYTKLNSRSLDFFGDTYHHYMNERSHGPEDIEVFLSDMSNVIRMIERIFKDKPKANYYYKNLTSTIRETISLFNLAYGIENWNGVPMILWFEINGFPNYMKANGL